MLLVYGPLPPVNNSGFLKVFDLVVRGLGVLFGNIGGNINFWDSFSSVALGDGTRGGILNLSIAFPFRFMALSARGVVPLCDGGPTAVFRSSSFIFASRFSISVTIHDLV